MTDMVPTVGSEHPTPCFVGKPKHAVLETRLAFSSVRLHGFTGCSGVIVPLLFPQRWHEPLRWRSFFVQSPRLGESLAASPNRAWASENGRRSSPLPRPSIQRKPRETAAIGRARALCFRRISPVVGGTFHPGDYPAGRTGNAGIDQTSVRL